MIDPTQVLIGAALACICVAFIASCCDLREKLSQKPQTRPELRGEVLSRYREIGRQVADEIARGAGPAMIAPITKKDPTHADL